MSPPTPPRRLRRTASFLYGLLPPTPALRAAAALGLLTLLPTIPAFAAEDLREKVQSPASQPAADAVIDPAGAIFGVRFGATEDEVMQKFGQPAGFIRLDADRSAMLYGQNFLLLFYKEKLDGLRVTRAVFDWQISQWIKPSPPFATEEWTMSNGLREGMNLKEVVAIIKVAPPESRKYHLEWSTNTTNIEFTFSRYSDRGDGDDSYVLHGFLMARQHAGKNFWFDPPTRHWPGLHSQKQKVIGLGLKATPKGIRAHYIYKGSPADLAGVKPGDLVETINGQSTAGMTSSEFQRLIATADSHQLRILPKEGDPKDITVTKVENSTLDGSMTSPPADLLEVTVGQTAPDIEATTSDGKPIKLSDLKGRPVLINFTATWCQPCRLEAPKLVEAYAKYKDRGLEIISVYLDAKDKPVAAYAKALGATWPIRNDGTPFEGPAAMAYGIGAVPTNVLVGKDGKILQTEATGENLDPAIAGGL